MKVFHDAESHRAPIKAWVDGVQLEDEAYNQLLNTASLPFIHKHVAVMPDVHWGMGATVGSVIPTIGAIVPAAVGVDIGCGMVAAMTNLKASDLPSDLAPLRSAIERAVPHGRTDNGGRNDRGAWGNPPPHIVQAWEGLKFTFETIEARDPSVGKSNNLNHLGTLGTGNHFIEVCLDEAQNVWVMLHSGSRGVGNRIGSYFIEKAKKHMERWFVTLPDADLAYLPESCEDFTRYVDAVGWAQTFAHISRQLMLDATIGSMMMTLQRLVRVEGQAINCHHNYISKEHHYGKNVWVTRKGAVRARLGDLGIIPGSMGVQSYIVMGKGNPESFESCSHGAGRAMSRGKAKKTFTVEDHIAATAGVECKKDASVLDETPGAYKPIDAVMAAQGDLVTVVATLKQVLCVKG